MGYHMRSQSAEWELLETRVLSGQAQEDFIDLPQGRDILVVARNVAKSLSTLLALRVSIDNGVTFLSAFGDYIQISTSGLDTNVSWVLFHNINANLGRTAAIELKGSPPFQFAVNTNGPANAVLYLVNSASFINAVRVFPTAGGTLTTGTLYVFAR